MSEPREAIIVRKTGETDITLKLNLDGTGQSQIQTGISFFDHMLHLLAKHALIDLNLNCQGDLEVDGHHTVEDVGICLGKAIHDALATKKGIARYGQMYLPMDESLCMVAVDVSGRPYLEFRADLPDGKVGGFETELTEEFFRAVATHANLTLHINLFYGSNGHHMIECMFKAFARALRQAVAIDKREKGIPSTKGYL